MCILFVSSEQRVMDDGYRLIVASNRDEYYDRPTAPAHRWHEDPDVIGGRDLKLPNIGGTWLALNVRGKLAVLLNVHDKTKKQLDVQSRGRLVENYVKSDTTASEYFKTLSERVYDGFKLITICIRDLSFDSHSYTNVKRGNADEPPLKRLANGIQGFGNGAYLKVTEGEKRFAEIVRKYGHSNTKDRLIERLLGLLKCTKQHYPDDEILKWAPKYYDQKLISSIFTKVPDLGYGTRTHTIILLDHDGKIEFNEWNMSLSNNTEWDHQRFTSRLKCT